jgi:hypothetical protein
MSLNSPGRQTGHRIKSGVEGVGAQDRAAFTIAEFCEAHRISRSKLYELWDAGMFSYTGVLLSGAGAFAGLWFGYRFG